MRSPAMFDLFLAQPIKILASDSSTICCYLMASALLQYVVPRLDSSISLAILNLLFDRVLTFSVSNSVQYLILKDVVSSLTNNVRNAVSTNWKKSLIETCFLLDLFDASILPKSQLSARLDCFRGFLESLIFSLGAFEPNMPPDHPNTLKYLNALLLLFVSVLTKQPAKICIKLETEFPLSRFSGFCFQDNLAAVLTLLNVPFDGAKFPLFLLFVCKNNSMVLPPSLAMQRLGDLSTVMGSALSHSFLSVCRYFLRSSIVPDGSNISCMGFSQFLCDSLQWFKLYTCDPIVAENAGPRHIEDHKISSQLSINLNEITKILPKVTLGTTGVAINGEIENHIHSLSNFIKRATTTQKDELSKKLIRLIETINNDEIN